MKKRILTNRHRFLLLSGIVSLMAAYGLRTASAYERYNNGCADCHGSFTGSTTTKGSVFPSGNKHEMHRASSYMNADCDLCHTSGDGRDPFIGSSNGTSSNAGLGCTGCHMAEGLRAHHLVNNVTDCLDCHENDNPAPDENVKPPYYGTADTNVDNPTNDVLAANINENWTIGDFIGLDTDGDNLYDVADYSCGPFRMLEAVQQDGQLAIRWITAGGRSEILQATENLTNAFVDVSSVVSSNTIGVITQEVTQATASLPPVRFYQVRSEP